MSQGVLSRGSSGWVVLLALVACADILLSIAMLIPMFVGVIVFAACVVMLVRLSRKHSRAG